MTVGQRAAKAIRDRAKKNGETLEREADKVYVSRKVINDWEIHNRNPQAFFLQQMALAGYDIYWILLGGKNGEQ
jgi:transcriptional regulator with XRE-family HTH domain